MKFTKYIVSWRQPKDEIFTKRNTRNTWKARDLSKYRRLKGITSEEIIFLCQLGIKKEMFDLTFKKEQEKT